MHVQMCITYAFAHAHIQFFSNHIHQKQTHTCSQYPKSGIWKISKLVKVLYKGIYTPTV